MHHLTVKKITQLAGLALIVTAALLFAVFTGDQGPWYFAWAVGTIMTILIASMGAILLDTQEERAKATTIRDQQATEPQTTNRLKTQREENLS